MSKFVEFCARNFPTKPKPKFLPRVANCRYALLAVPSRSIANWLNIRLQNSKVEMWAPEIFGRIFGRIFKRRAEQGLIASKLYFSSFSLCNDILVIKFMKCTSKLCTESFCYKKMALIQFEITEKPEFFPLGRIYVPDWLGIFLRSWQHSALTSV